MKLFKLITLLFLSSFAISDAMAQANAYINILTQNGGQVAVGATVNIEVTVGNTGPVSPIGVNKVRAQISVPIAICNVLPAAQQTGLPPGWTVSAYTGGGASITVCNGSDIIPVGAARTILIAVQGNIIGGPSTVNGNLLFSNGTSCTAPGSLPGDNTADNSSTSSIQVIAGCPLGVTASAGTIACNGGTTTLTATATGASGPVEYSITGGTSFQTGNIFTIPAGTYTIIAREVNTPTCTATSNSVTVTEPAAVPAPVAGIVHPTCTVATGTISITSSTAGLTFSLDGGAYATYPAGGYAVPAGAHTLRAQDAGNCISAITNITINAQPPTPAAPTASVVQPTCTVATATISITSATAGLTFSFDGGAYAAYPVGGYTSIASGAHTLTAQNTNNCISAVTNITVNAQPPTPAAPTTSVIQPTCTVATGTITITSTTAGLIFSLDAGAYAAYPAGGYIVSSGAHTLAAQNTGGCISAVTNITINAQPPTPAPPSVGTITQPTCAVSTGSVVLNGLPAGNWTINPGAITGNTSSATINNLAAGTYNYTVTNAVGCTSPASASIIINPVPGAPAAPTVSVVQPTCTVATATITITSATSGLTFSLDGAAYAPYPAGGYTGIAAGAHTLTLQNVASCISPVTHITVNTQPPTPVAPTVSIIQPTCTLATGAITVTSVTGGLIFSLDAGAYAVYPAGGYVVSAGAHTLTAQNTSGCISAVTNININAQPPTPAAPAVGTITQPTCAVVTGSVVLNALPSGNWIINPGAISGTGAGTTITGLTPATTYNFTVTNDVGCISAPSANVVINPIAGTPPAPTINVVNPTCTVATGIINVTSSTSGLTFSLDGAAYATYPAGGYVVGAGAHTLTAQNIATSCISAVTNITVNAQPPTPVAPTVNITQPTCTVATGIITITSATAGLLFSLDGGAYAAYPAGGYIVAAGSHTLTAQNTSTCISAVTNIIVNAQPPTPAAPTVNIVQPTCAVATGIITITSATAGLTFSLDGGTYTAYPAGGYTVTAGSHTLTAQNASTCISAVTNIIVITQPPTPLAPTVNITQPTCAIATATIIISSPTAGLTFSLDGATYAAYPAGGYIVTTGTHTLTAQNTTNCISAVTNITVNAQPTKPTATAVAGSIACNGGTTTLTVTATGGTAPYEYSLNGITFQPANTFTVAAGVYTVIVRGANLCTTTVAVTVVQPTAIAITATASPIACNGGAATLTVTASGGTAPLQYSLNGGAYQSANTFTVAPGVQTVTVKDANGCIKTAAAITITQPVILTASSTAPRITTCGGKTLVTVTAAGGRTPYTGAGTFMKGPGIWNFTVTDAGGCTATTNIIIEAPGCMDLEVFPNPAQNSININHSVAEAGAIMQVFDMKGALLFSKTIPLDAFLTNIDISRLHAATYVLVFINGKDKKSVRFEKLSH
jgi:large repetitive protein